MKQLAYITGFLLILLSGKVSGQVYTATAKLDTSRIRIGEQTSLTFTVRYPADVENGRDPAVRWIPFSDTLTKNIEIISKTGPDTTISPDSGTVILRHQLVITSFDTGFFVIPPVDFYRPGDVSRPVSTQALLLEVSSVEVDTTKAIRDIAMPMDAPFTLGEAMPWLIGGIAAIIAILLGILIYLRLSRKKAEPVQEEAPLPPHLVALERLDELEKQKLWEAGKIKEHYSLLTDIIRDYLEKRYGIPASEQTSAEILFSLKEMLTDQPVRNSLREILLVADMVKFAKEQPAASENNRLFEAARNFVSTTAASDDTSDTEMEVAS